MSSLQIIFPGKLVFGNGTLAQLADEVLQLKPAKVFIATITPLEGSIAGFTTALKNNAIEILIDTSIVNEPTFADFEKLMRTVAPFNPDVVIDRRRQLDRHRSSVGLQSAGSSAGRNGRGLPRREGGPMLTEWQERTKK